MGIGVWGLGFRVVQHLKFYIVVPNIIIIIIVMAITIVATMIK